ncbi:hypothetical protein MLDJOKPK_00094 [Salmonella phage SPAsTU]|nr:hypothetical protein STsAS_051 [Salmonella phage STsAS]AWN09032.1 hypothetical protein MLDJOKPK_00094 [Salmonella phage SPAsTU]
MGILISDDGKKGVVLRELEANESVEIDKQTGARTLVVGPKSVIPVPDWKEELAKFRGELRKK